MSHEAYCSYNEGGSCTCMMRKYLVRDAQRSSANEIDRLRKEKKKLEAKNRKLQGQLQAAQSAEATKKGTG